MIAAARARNPVEQRRRMLPDEPGPSFLPKRPHELRERRQRMEQAEEEAGAHRTTRIQLEHSHMTLREAHLGVADDAVAAKLEPSDRKISDFHTGSHPFARH